MFVASIASGTALVKPLGIAEKSTSWLGVSPHFDPRPFAFEAAPLSAPVEVVPLSGPFDLVPLSDRGGEVPSRAQSAPSTSAVASRACATACHETLGILMTRSLKQTACQSASEAGLLATSPTRPQPSRQGRSEN